MIFVRSKYVNCFIIRGGGGCGVHVVIRHVPNAVMLFFVRTNITLWPWIAQSL